MWLRRENWGLGRFDYCIIELKCVYNGFRVWSENCILNHLSNSPHTRRDQASIEGASAGVLHLEISLASVRCREFQASKETP